MKYMLLIYNRPGFVEEMTEAERDELFGEVDTVMAELRKTGELVGGAALADHSQTKPARVRDGAPAAPEGPFIEAKEQFAGFITVDCDGVERATEIAASWPDARRFAMEVRPLMHESGAEM